jgi:hypothetical protein
MPRRQTTLGKKPGGRFRGVPGNAGVQRGFGDAFKKRGAFGMLNPMEWMGFGKRQGFGEAVPRDQFSLQQVISENLSIETGIAQERAEQARQRVNPPTVMVPTPPGEMQRRTPSTSTKPAPPASKPAPIASKPSPAPKPAPKATPKQAAPTPVAAIRKVPLKRGR